MMALRTLLKPLLLALALLLGSLLHAEARADMLVVVNEHNPLESLTLKEVKQLFLGRMRRFPAIDSDVNVLDREEASTAHRDFYRHVVGMDPNRLKRYRARYLFSGQGRLPETIQGQKALLEKVRASKSAVGYIALPKAAPLPAGIKVVYREPMPDPDPVNLPAEKASVEKVSEDKMPAQALPEQEVHSQALPAEAGVQ